MATTIEVLLRTNGGPTPAITKNKEANGEGGGDAPPPPGPDTKILTQIFGGVRKFVKGQLGLNFGVGALMKQSQIFTSTIGVIFQLLGALVDVMLAPLLPLFIPLIRGLGKLIPIASRWMETVVAPAIMAIVSWLEGFFGRWDGSWDMLWGSEGLGGLWDKFKQWWDSSGEAFFKEKLADIRDWIGQKIVEMFEWFKGASTRVQGWITTAIITQTGRVLGWLIKAPGFLLRLLLKIPGMLVKMIGTLIRMFPFGKIFTRLTGLAGRLLKLVGNLLLNIAKGIISSIMKLPILIFKKVTGMVSSVFAKLGGVVKGIPIIGGKLSKMMKVGENLSKAASKNPQLLGRYVSKALGGSKLLTTMGSVARLSKAIPYVGAVATAAFGAYETTKAVSAAIKGEGTWAQAGVIAGKTALATGLQVTGASAAGLAVDIGGTLLANAMGKNTEALIKAVAVSGTGAAYPGGPDRGLITLNMSTTIQNAEGSVQSEVMETKKQHISDSIEQVHALEGAS